MIAQIINNGFIILSQKFQQKFQKKIAVVLKPVLPGKIIPPFLRRLTKVKCIKLICKCYAVMDEIISV